MASIWVPWAPGSPLTVSSPLKAWTVPGIPTVGRYLSRNGTPKGDCGIVFDRKCEISYDLDRGFAKDCAQRCQVAEPSVLAIPSSSPAPQREGAVVVCASAAEISALAAASAHTNRDVNIIRLPDICRYAARSRGAIRARTFFKVNYDDAGRRRRQGLEVRRYHRQAWSLIP